MTYARQPRFQVYRDRKGEWRWRLLAANGRTIADSGEGYAQKQGAQRAARMVIATVERIGHKAMIDRIKANPVPYMTTQSGFDPVILPRNC